ncbi:MAG: N-acetyl-alpha-D-glucosaminyl L-malate synthase BshA [Thermoflavifilum sp.]|nr:N-acetyl-alpha-D-glucosaminyl L-malate synthase BshA [Thermoflavifilum sp.]MCL6513937.1 N-acetyl-alpha-D-glucosaminyl L-malate synthase BshA [Alicyclobacillus sp.]
MKIGISCYPTLGGSGAVATELGKALARRGHEVHFIVTDVPFRLGSFYRNLYVHELQTPTYPVFRTPPHDLALAALMADITQQYGLDVLHVHYALPFAICALLANELLAPRRIPVVTTLHGTDVTVLAEDRSLYGVIRLGLERSHVITAVSHHLAAQTRELFPLRRPVTVIHNFVDPEVFRPRTHDHVRRCFVEGHERLLIHASNFRAVKRIPDVLDVFREVANHLPAKLLMVGEGPEWPRARRLAMEMGLADQVLFLGKQDEVAELMAAADLFLLPSERESFGLVALEAMASGVPVIASRAGGIPEVVEDGVTGFLADVGATTQMADAAVRLLTDEALYRRMSEAARERAVLQFHVEDKVAEYERVYEQAVAEVTALGG